MTACLTIFAPLSLILPLLALLACEERLDTASSPAPPSGVDHDDALPAPIDPGFDIETVFVFGNTFTRSQEHLFLQAVARWESVITADVADYDLTIRPIDTDSLDWWNNEDWGVASWGRFVIDDEIDDLRVFVTTSTDTSYWGWAGPFLFREDRDRGLPVLARVAISEEVLTSEHEDSGALLAVMMHELGHALGFSDSTWEGMDLLGKTSALSDGADAFFRGALARLAFDAVGGRVFKGNKVPLENGNLSHWRESVFGNELMTPTPSGRDPGPLSSVTIQSLADIGYEVDVGQAEDYELPRSATKRMATGNRPRCLVIHDHL